MVLIKIAEENETTLCDRDFTTVSLCDTGKCLDNTIFKEMYGVGYICNYLSYPCLLMQFFTG